MKIDLDKEYHDNLVNGIKKQWIDAGFKIRLSDDPKVIELKRIVDDFTRQELEDLKQS